MIDASVAVRCKTHPALATDLQALCWGSYGLCGIIAAPIQGWIIDSLGPDGSQLLFGMAGPPAAVVIVPALCGWLYEERKPRGERNPKLSLCLARFAEPEQAPIFKVALLVPTAYYCYCAG